MDRTQLQREILACLPSEFLKTRLDEMGYIFTDSELLGIAFHYAPSFAERLRLMGLLAEQCPTVSDHARKCIRWQEVCLERFKAHGENEIYELHIKDTPDAYEERYLCRSYEAALEMIDGFYKEYAFTPDPRASYTVEKRKILDVGQAFEEDALGGCTLRTGKVLVSVDRFPEETEHGPCPEDCNDCGKVCISNMDIFFPAMVADRSPICYTSTAGLKKYGIHLNFSGDEKLTEYYVIPFEGTLLESGDYDEWWGGHWHLHIPCPKAEPVASEDLPPEYKKRYESFLLWLKERYTEHYGQK